MFCIIFCQLSYLISEWALTVESFISFDQVRKSFCNVEGCNFQSVKRCNVVSHVQAKHLPDFPGYPCYICNTVLKTHNSYVQHKNRFHKHQWIFPDLNSEIECLMQKLDSGRWQCVSCGWESKFRARLWEHIESVHVKTSGYSCEICEKFCPSKNAYKIHKSRYHRQSVPALSYWITWALCFSPE